MAKWRGHRRALFLNRLGQTENLHNLLTTRCRFPQLARSNHFAVIARAVLIVLVIPAVFSTDCFAVFPLVREAAQVNQEIGKTTAQRSAPGVGMSFYRTRHWNWSRKSASFHRALGKRLRS